MNHNIKRKVKIWVDTLFSFFNKYRQKSLNLRVFYEVLKSVVSHSARFQFIHYIITHQLNLPHRLINHIATPNMCQKKTKKHTLK